MWLGLGAACDDPDRVHQARNVTEKRKQNVQPECAADAHPEEHAERGKQDGQEDAEQIHGRPVLETGRHSSNEGGLGIGILVFLASRVGRPYGISA